MNEQCVCPKKMQPTANPTLSEKHKTELTYRSEYSKQRDIESLYLAVGVNLVLTGLDPVLSRHEARKD